MKADFCSWWFRPSTDMKNQWEVETDCDFHTSTSSATSTMKHRGYGILVLLFWQLSPIFWSRRSYDLSISIMMKSFWSGTTIKQICQLKVFAVWCCSSIERRSCRLFFVILVRFLLGLVVFDMLSSLRRSLPQGSYLMCPIYFPTSRALVTPWRLLQTPDWQG